MYNHILRDTIENEADDSTGILLDDDITIDVVYHEHIKRIKCIGRDGTSTRGVVSKFPISKEIQAIWIKALSEADYNRKAYHTLDGTGLNNFAQKELAFNHGSTYDWIGLDAVCKDNFDLRGVRISYLVSYSSDV